MRSSLWPYILAAAAQPLVVIALELRRRHRLRQQAARRAAARPEPEPMPDWQTVVAYIKDHKAKRYAEMGRNPPPPSTWLSRAEIDRVGKMVNDMYRGCLHFWLARYCTSLASWWTIEKTMTRFGQRPPRPRYFAQEGKVLGSSMHEYEQEL